MNTPKMVFKNYGVMGESGYSSPTVEMTLHDEVYTRNELLEEFQTFMKACSYHFDSEEFIEVVSSEAKPIYQEPSESSRFLGITKMMELESQIVHWHYARNLIEGSTDKQQFKKLVEEVAELSASIKQGNSVIDDIGDIIVVLTNIAERNALSLSDCMEHAYNDIKDRKGKMIDGIFVKESDFEDDS